jgi:biofilm protein TabA
MILDTLANAARYAGLKNGLSEGFGFLDQPGIETMADGRYEISGDMVYAIIERTQGRSIAEGKLEAHRKHLDIQYIISGEESMGWSPRESLPASGNYDPDRDLEVFDGDPQSIARVPPGSFAVFLPSDAHLPLIGSGPIHKVVVKVAVG